ncbi:hypothetical protein IMG5_132040, partial [Ichthyophthirius multifiliis]
MIDSWNPGVDFLSIQINGVIFTKLYKNVASTNTCGKNDLNEEYQQANIDFKTNQQSIDIQITSNFKTGMESNIRSFGITEFTIYVFECMPQCAKCNDGTSCSSCLRG